jgi:endonuclease/exonuclease/phosphatase family metal-dependent hydrolase
MFIFGQSTKDSSLQVRVLTYNIYHGETMNGDFNLDYIADVIKSVKPDIVALQEVDFKTNRAKKMDLATELGYRTGLAPLFGKAMSFSGGAYGVGILSAFPFHTTQCFALPGQPDREPRVALEAKIILGKGDTIRFVSTHLDSNRDEKDRKQQGLKLNELFGQDDIISIIAGDLNATPTSETMKILNSKWSQSFKEKIPTSPSSNPRVKIDYVLFRPINRWKVVETRVINDKIGSDHCPVLSVLELDVSR